MALDLTDSGVLAATMLIDMARGYQLSQALYVAAKLGVADCLRDGPRSSDELAQATGTHAPSLYRLLRVLASRGVFEEVTDGRFGLTPLGDLLRSDVVSSVRAELLLWGHPILWGPWGHLLHSVETGERAFDHLYGVGIWEYLARHPEDGAMFNAGIAAGEYHTQLSTVYDFSGINLIVDIGGGNGRLLSAVLRANPATRGVLLDTPGVVSGADEILRAEGVAERCRVIAGDFFAELPSGGDVYVLSRVLMDWDDEHAVTILRNCRRAVAEQGRLLVMERVIPPDNAPSLSQLSDLLSLAITGGRIRSESEMRQLFARARFRLTTVIPTPAGYSVLEGCLA
jgi:predicted O-methyltransferase YrrM